MPIAIFSKRPFDFGSFSYITNQDVHSGLEWSLSYTLSKATDCGPCVTEGPDSTTGPDFPRGFVPACDFSNGSESTLVSCYRSQPEPSK